MRFSDLDKGKKPLAQAPQHPPPAAQKAAPPPPPEPAPSVDEPQPPPSEEARWLAHRAYGEAVSAVRLLYKSPERPAVSLHALEEAVRGLWELLRSDRDALLAMTLRSTASNYLYAHAVNTAVLAMQLARGLRWGEDQQKLLGLCGMLHDIGMTQHMDLVQEKRRLSAEELAPIRRHPLQSRDWVLQALDAPEPLRRAVAEIVAQVHERKGGHGYPRGLGAAEEIHPGAQVLGVCDAYAAMSHPRSWRPPLLPHDAVKAVLKQREADFESRVVKALVEQLSLFPPGSYARLSTGELACVVKTHLELPTRPAVELRLQADGSRQEPPRLVDLATYPIVHITHAVDETRLAAKDKRLLLQLEANRWWTE